MVDHPRYQKEPLKLFFDMYVTHVVGGLSKEEDAALERMNLPKAMNTSASDWKSAVREILNLSSTFDIAVADLWLRNQETARANNMTARDWAPLMVDEYLKEGSEVDVWPDGALEEAKRRIAASKGAAPNADGEGIGDMVAVAQAKKPWWKLW